MKKSLRFKILTACLAVGAAAAFSCSVNKDNLTFDDDEFARLSGDGGTTSGDGGSGNGSGGDGSGGTSTASGGMGGGTSEPENMPGDLRCTGLQVEFFAGGETWAPLGDPCEFLCVDGACTGACQPDSTECVSGTEARTCDSAGAWQPETCQFACVGEACGGECVPGARQCDGKQKQICGPMGSWTNEGAECFDECTETGDTAECTGGCLLGSTQCSGDGSRLLACQAGGSGTVFMEAENCRNPPSSFLCITPAMGDAECGGECVPGSKDCVGNGLRTCDASGKWGAPSQCAGQACVEQTGAMPPNAQCDGECEPGQRQCGSDGSVQECNSAGKWESELCKSGLTCIPYDDGGGKIQPICGECNPGTEKEEVRRCHNPDFFPTVETCIFADDTTVWKQTDDCKGDLCWQGECYNDPKEVCSESRNLGRGCVDAETEWTCSKITPPIQTKKCDERRFESCRLLSCEPGGGRL